MPRGRSWQPPTSIYAKRCPRRSMAERAGAWNSSTRRYDGPIRLLRQREHREVAAERRIVAQRRVATDGAEAGGVHVPLGGFQCAARRCTARSALPCSGTLRGQQPGRETDAGPAADAGQYRHVLPAALLIGGDVADDARRGLELVEFLARLGVDRLEIALERAVEHHAAGGGERPRPDRELLLVRPGDLAGLAV